MITIFSSKGLIYTPSMVDSGYILTSAVKTKELNKAGSLRFTLPPSNPLYGRLERLTDEVWIEEDGAETWRGRVLYNDRDFYNCKEIVCEGQLAYLNDSTVRPYTFTGTVKELLKEYLTVHNSRVDEWKRFQPGNITVSGTVDITSIDYAKTWTEIENKLLSKFGGVMSVRRENGVNYIDYVAETARADSQIIQFGKNLLDLSEHISAEDVYTVLIPLGKSMGEDQGRVNISSVNGGRDYIVNEAAARIFGNIEHIEYFDIEDPSELKARGEEFILSGAEMLLTLEIRAVDFHRVDFRTERIDTGFSNRVLSHPHGIDSYFVCSKIEDDLLNPENSVFTYGSTLRSMTDMQFNAQKQTQNAADMIIRINDKADNAVSTVNSAQQVIREIAEDVTRTAEEASTTATSASNEIVEIKNKNLLRENPYKNKNVSIYGDSISTFSGYGLGYDQYPGNASFQAATGITSVNQTWWMQVINRLDMRLLKNASIAGRCVTEARQDSGAAVHKTSAAYRQARIDQLKDGATLPDVIFVYVGVNDYNHGSYLGSLEPTKSLATIESEFTAGVTDAGNPPNNAKNFIQGYKVMLKRLMSTYPNAEIWCCTLAHMKPSDHGGGTDMPEVNRSGEALSLYNQAIIDVATQMGVKILRNDMCGITAFNQSSTTADTLHPNAAGMKLIADEAQRTL